MALIHPGDSGSASTGSGDRFSNDLEMAEGQTVQSCMIRPRRKRARLANAGREDLTLRGLWWLGLLAQETLRVDRRSHRDSERTQLRVRIVQ